MDYGLYGNWGNNSYLTFQQAYNNAQKTLPQNTKQQEAEKKQTIDSKTKLSFKSSMMNKAETSKETSSKVVGGFALGAAAAGIAAWILTRGKVKPSGKNLSILRNLRTVKKSKLEYDDLQSFASNVKNLYGENVDKVKFLKGSELTKFAQEGGRSLEITGLGELAEKDILAVACKGEEPLFTTLFKPTSWNNEIKAIFGSEPIHVITS